MSELKLPLVLVPAYGAKYITFEANLAAWKAGADFKIYGGPYCSIRDKDELLKKFKLHFLDYLDIEITT